MLRGLKRLNKYENRILRIAKLGGKNVRIFQQGFSRKTKEGFRFPIHSLEIGSESAIKKKPVGLVAGVHGLETIGIRVLLDFLEYILDSNSLGYLPEIEKGKMGIVCLPIVNPGGVALKMRANPAGVDLMRNSGVEADDPMPFFGGHKMSPKLPYYRGNTMEPEARTLYRFVKKYFFESKNSCMSVLDIHSGFGTIDHVWWPFAFTKEKCRDEELFIKMSEYLKETCHNVSFRYGPQSESYTTNGDLWDRFYLHFNKEYRNGKETQKSAFLPWTLEIGTWSDLKKNPLRTLKKRGIFNPSKENKSETITGYRKLLTDFVKMATMELDN